MGDSPNDEHKKITGLTGFEFLAEADKHFLVLNFCVV